MERPARILSVGMTGGIACGRSTIGRIFSGLGACVIDMDDVAHNLMAPGGIAAPLIGEVFGGDYLDSDGGVRRKALGDLVFSSAFERSRLEAILHPMILDESARMITEWAADRTAGGGVAISDAALLVETGGYKRYQRLVVVICRPELQLNRLMARDGLTEAQARSRIAAQAPLQVKAGLADYLIETSGTLAETQARAREVYALLLEDLRSLPDLPQRRPS